MILPDIKTVGAVKIARVPALVFSHVSLGYHEVQLVRTISQNLASPEITSEALFILVA
jgi:hypothetical protein